MTLTQWLAVWFIASVVTAPFIGNWLHKRGVENQYRADRARLKEIEQPIVALHPAIVQSDARWTDDDDPGLAVAAMVFRTGRTCIGNVDSSRALCGGRGKCCRG